MSLCILNRRVPAFTLIELLAGMIVSGIIVTVAWTSLQIISERARVSILQKEQAEELSFFCRAIYVDFASADRIHSGEAGLTLKTDTHEVEYRFVESYVIRATAMHTDTFRVQVSDPVYTRDADETEIVSVRFNVQVNNDKSKLYFIRKEDAVNKLRRDD